MKHSYVRPVKVYCDECQEYQDEAKTKFINIEEDIFGRDLLTFECPKCKTEQKSLRVT